MSRVLRIIHGDSAPPRSIEEQAFIAEVEAFVGTAPALRGGASLSSTQSSPAEGIPLGGSFRLPCTVESLDGLGRLRWRAYCSTREGLLDLARELGQERSMAAGSSTGPPRKN